MIYDLIIVLLFLQLILGWRNLKYGIIFMIILSMLIPNTLKFSLGPISLNVFNLTTAVYFICCIRYLKTDFLIDTVLRKYLILLVVYIVGSAFLLNMTGVGFGFWLKNSILTVFEYFLLAYTFLYIRFDDDEIKEINITILVASLIVALYAIFNYLTKSNPYIAFVALLTNTVDAAEFFINEQRGALAGRVSSTFAHPLILGQMMLLIFSYLIFYLKDIVNKKLCYAIGFMLIIPIVLCGSRSSLIPLFFIPILYIIKMGKENILKYVVIGLIVLPISVSFLPKEIQNTAEAVIYFWDDKKSDKIGIAGSNNEMRIDQHLNALKIINNNPLLGKGNGYVINQGAKHPEMLGYEGMLLHTLVDWGILGTIFFLWFYYFLFSYLKRKAKGPQEMFQIMSLCSCYFISALITGISYSTFSFFFLLYFLTLNHLENRRIEENELMLDENTDN